MSLAGFVDVECTPFTASMRVESAEMYLGYMERGGAPFAMLRKKLGAEAWAKVHEQLLEGVRRRLPGAPVELSAEALLTRGQRAA
jgi:hypothetical protein